MSSPETSTRDGISENGAKVLDIDALHHCRSCFFIHWTRSVEVLEETPHQPHPALSPSQA